MLNSLVRLFAGCNHASTYRERRPLHDANVMHLVCNDCGHAVPAVQRTAEEHRLVIAAGTVRLPQARSQTNLVIKRGFRRSA